jgi:hypothetical protein
MVKPMSTPRQRYETAYRRLRLYSGILHNLPSFPMYDEYYDCAILSYDYHDSEFHGWTNLTRMSEFHKVRIKRNLSAWDIQF